MVRKPVASGQFYSHKEKDLRKDIESFNVNTTSKISAKGLILPHAGYSCSGNVVATTINKVLPKKNIIILGPNHTGLGADFSLWSSGAWEIPFGNIQIDEKLAQAILAKNGHIEKDFLAHLSEHSIEVELPFIYHFFGDFKFVPIACKISSLNKYQEVALQIFEGIKNIKKDILLVASTDLTHYEPDLTARKQDRLVIETLVGLDEKTLVERVKSKGISMCGVAPVAIFIACLKMLGAKKSQVALYQTSGDTTGDYSSVVGYVGIIIN